MKSRCKVGAIVGRRLHFKEAVVTHYYLLGKEMELVAMCNKEDYQKYLRYLGVVEQRG